METVLVFETYLSPLKHFNSIGNDVTDIDKSGDSEQTLILKDCNYRKLSSKSIGLADGNIS